MNLRNLQTFSINKDFFNSFYRNEIKESNPSSLVRKKEPVPKKTNNTSVVKNKFKSLFWTFYSLIHSEKEILETNKFKFKNAFSLKFIEDIKKDKAFLKQNKLKFHDIESSILYDHDINLITLKCLTLFFKLNLIYSWNNKYYVFDSNDDDDYYYIERNREEYNVDSKLAKEFILTSKVKNKLYMEGVRTTLKSMSSYKLDELIEISGKLHIELNKNNKRKTKQQLYEEIIIKID